MKSRSVYIVDFENTGKTAVDLIGGKGANLAELYHIKTLHVPEGFCITTEAYKSVTENNPALDDLLARLGQLKATQGKEIRETSEQIRWMIETAPIPGQIETEITRQIERFGKEQAFAVRSSATAEDLPAASFAGQQDTYLNVIGNHAILASISKCWASFFTDRAVSYRIQNGFDHRQASLSVIVQKMVFAEVAGVLFTAHPVNGNRKVSSIDASFGLGEALVSGLVTADNYQVINSGIIDKRISQKRVAMVRLENGGTIRREIDPKQQEDQALSDEEIIKLEQIGRMIEAHFGAPQDIEWCLAKGLFHIVQSRPITTLYPAPQADDQENHVYVSVGHQQMMTDPIKPLGMSVWSLTGGRPIFRSAGGRLFVDVTANLSSPEGRQNLLDVLGHSDPLIGDALSAIIEREGFIKSQENDQSKHNPVKSHRGMSVADILAEAGNDPNIVATLIKISEQSLSVLKHEMGPLSGTDVFDRIQEDMRQRRQLAFDQKNLSVIMAAIHASAWINEKLDEWLGQKNTADIISLSVPNNITSQMGMDLLNVCDVIRAYPDIIRFLEQADKDGNFLDKLARFEGGVKVQQAISLFLAKYGMRCTGEIDITRTRWSEKPGLLLPMLLSSIRNLEPGESKRKFEEGRQKASEKAQELLSLLKALPDGEQKAGETRQMIELIRNYIGYREYPKYDIVSRYFVYRQALLREANRLVQDGLLQEKEDAFYLTFEEFRDAVHSHALDYQLIAKRKAEYLLYEKLTPPRVITSDGEIVTGKYKRGDFPAKAIPGLAVSSGIVEGRARVVLKVEDASLEDGDILVTAFTDPSWTPLFLSIKGLVTEVGGLMTHGAVVAREYGLPAVVGVENATKLIPDKAMIRLNGSAGFVEIL
ncbi:phosphoenolpyruvate synthase [Pedobacter africanus]|uniref:Prodigiosin synthesizing transferase PigC n=1 Tax=Pedobacter africanus TaxID=151894 RepID=A0A1W2CVR6_9SPHI|nr:phosphoenolpyruvate synthase [Pedobacter africanus]SMC89347.1 pyruvate, water dikinase [Pedobacter africanus]